jgi:hypothetical protein
MKPATASHTQHVRNLQRRIGVVRRKRLAVTIATGAAWAVTAFVATISAEALLDWLAGLPWLVRALALAGALGGAGYFLWRDVFLPLRKRLTDDAVALIIERELPKFRTRYIASIQLARAEGGGAQSSLVRALLAETDALANAMNFREIVRAEAMKRALRIAGLTLLGAVALGWAGGSATPLLLKRAALLNVPLPTKTHIVQITGDRRISIGEDFKIEVSATGVLPAAGKVLVTQADGQKREFALEPEPDQGGHYSAVIRSAQGSFRYLVKLNDTTSGPHTVTAVVRPLVAEIECRQQFPKYLNLAPVNLPASDLKLFAGSRLMVTVKASVPIKEAHLKLAGLDTKVPMAIDPKTPLILRGEFDVPAQNLTGFSVWMMDTTGIESGETALYRIDIVPDEKPAVKILYPTRREDLATPAATVRVAFEAKDDFGVSKVVLHYAVADKPEKTLTFDLAGRSEKSLARRFEWKLRSVRPGPQVGDVLEYWLTAEDTNTVTGPGVGTTERYQIKIVSEEEKKLDLANRLSDTINGIGEVTGSQEELNRKLGETIFTKPPTQP